MHHGRGQTKCRQGPPTPHTEKHLLVDAVLLVTPVEPVGDRSGPGGIPVDPGVEQIEANRADPGEPRPGEDGTPRRFDADRHPGIDQTEVGGLVGVVVDDLTSCVETLVEVPVGIEQPDADQAEAEVAGGLEMIARQNAEAARVLGQGLRDPEFGRDVGRVDRHRGIGRTQRTGGCLEGLDPTRRPPKPFGHSRIGGEGVDRPIVERSGDGVRVPAVPVDEEHAQGVPDLDVPGPDVVGRNAAKIGSEGGGRGHEGALGLVGRSCRGAGEVGTTDVESTSPRSGSVGALATVESMRPPGRNCR